VYLLLLLAGLLLLVLASGLLLLVQLLASFSLYSGWPAPPRLFLVFFRWTGLDREELKWKLLCCDCFAYIILSIVFVVVTHMPYMLCVLLASGPLFWYMLPICLSSLPCASYGCDLSSSIWAFFFYCQVLFALDLLMMHRLKPKTDKNRFYLAPFDLYSMMS
jgi:hypothetical protein